jgi:hypothetical protein
MAEISFSLSALFEKTFGYKTRAFEPQFRRVTGDGDNASGRTEQGKSGSPYYANDALGMEYFMPVTISYPDTRSTSTAPQATNIGEGNGTFSTLKKWDLPYPIISIESKKTLVETLLTERRGTIKELICTNDYEITIKGFIIANTHEYPDQGVATLREIYEQNTAISIQSPLTDIFLLRPDRSGSDQGVIKELKLIPTKGIKNITTYELKLLSDEPFNLVSF